MSLLELVDNSRTDKNTTHSYLDLYHFLLQSKKETAKNVLEVGIHKGGSIKLWSDYFPNAQVYGLDIQRRELVWEELKNKENIHIYAEQNAYDEFFFKNEFLDKNIKFDFMIDDGPHTLPSMIQFIKLYSQLITEDGILIIEDVQQIEWLNMMKAEVPEHLKKYVQTYDLRETKGRYDDIVFCINKSL